MRGWHKRVMVSRIDSMLKTYYTLCLTFDRVLTYLGAGQKSKIKKCGFILFRVQQSTLCAEDVQVC